ncbi:hypothetical protein D3C73_880440 [compost metagenome]
MRQEAPQDVVEYGGRPSAMRHARAAFEGGGAGEAHARDGFAEGDEVVRTEAAGRIAYLAAPAGRNEIRGHSGVQRDGR